MTTALILRRENLMRFGILFLLAFALRWSYVTWKQVGPRAKQGAQEMERVAISWAEQGRLADAFADGSGDTAHVGPLYPMLLGSVYRMLGTDTYHRFIGRSYLGILATCLGIALIPTLAALLSFDRRAGLAAGIVLAVTPTFFWLEIVGDWEQSTTALVLIVLLMLFIRLHDSQWRSWLLVAMGGLSTGLATLFSPTLAPAFVLIIVAESLSGGTHGLRRMIPRVAVLACIAALTMVPWTIRNYRALGGIVPTRSGFGMNLWLGNNPESIGRSSPWEQASKLSWDNPFTSRAELDRLLQVGELAYNREKGDQAVHWITLHPRRFAALTAHRFRLFWLPPADMWAPVTPLAGLRSLLLMATALGAFAGALWLAVAGNSYRWLLLSALIGPSLIYYIVHVNFRYRYPIWALSVLLCCQFLGMLVSFWRAHQIGVDSRRMGHPRPGGAVGAETVSGISATGLRPLG